MKTKHTIQCFFLFLVVFVLSSHAFAIQGTSSDGSVTAKNGGTSAAAASGTSSDSTITGRVSAGGSGVSSPYSGVDVSGNPGPDVSTSDPSSETETETETEEESSSTIPSGGGGGGGGSGGADSGAGESSAAETTTEATETTAEAAQTTEESTVGETIGEPVTIAIELSDGSSVTLSPETGAASMTVVEVTETSATIIIESAQTSENSITGAVVIGVEQETTLLVGETVEVDSDGDGEIDLEITLTKIVYDEETGKYRGIFTTTYLHPTKEIIAFVEEQIASGQVALVERPSMERMVFGYWIWLLVALLVIGVVGFIIWVLKDKKTKKYVPTTIPTHYFEKILRSELGQHTRQQKQQEQKQENTEEKKKVSEEKKAASKGKSVKKKTKKKKKIKTGKSRKKRGKRRRRK